MSKPTWYEIKNTAGDGAQAAEIYLYGDIGDYGLTAASFVSQLRTLNGVPLDVYICSLGGGVFDGIAIFNALDRYPGAITVHIESIAASIASVIAMAGDMVHMPANALMMMHNPSGIELGEADDMRRYADLLDKVKGTIVTCYTGKTGLDAKTVGAMMDDTTWLTAGEAMELGFCDYIDAPVEMTNSLGKLRDGVDTKCDGVKLSEILAKLSGGKQPKAEATKDETKTGEGTSGEKKDATDPAKDEKAGEEKKEGDEKKEVTEEKPTVENLALALKNLRNDLTNFGAENKSLKAEKTTLTNRVQELEGEITNATTVAQNMLSAMCLDEALPRGSGDTGETPDAAKTDEEIYNVYTAIKDENKRREFRNKHKDAIYRGREQAGK